MSVRAWTCFALVSTLWGIPYLFIKVAVDGGVPPAFLAWARVTLGALVLLTLAWRAGTLRTVRGRWRWLAMYTVFEIVIPFPLIPARAADRLLARRHPDRHGATDRRAAGAALRPRRAGDGPAARRPAGRPGRRGGARRHRRGRQRARAARRGGDRRRGVRLRGRADGAQAHAGRPRPAGDDGRRARAGVCAAHAGGGDRAATRDAV